jgi:hypothetical protein
VQANGPHIRHLLQQKNLALTAALPASSFTRGSSTTVVDDVIEYEVDRVEATPYKGQGRQYLVQWVGYHDPILEPVGNLTNCAEKLKGFWHLKQMV